MPTISVQLPDDRTQTGTLSLLDDAHQVLAGPFQVGGRADQNSADQHGNSPRSTLLPFGDTPLGTYSVDGFQQPTNDDDANRHGPNGKIKLTPTADDALLAAQNGRTFLQIHGGYPGPSGNLRPTNGCLRLSNNDMASLIAAILLAGVAPGQCEATELVVSNPSAQPVDDVGDDGDGDPPPDSPTQPMPSPLP